MLSEEWRVKVVMNEALKVISESKIALLLLAF